MIELQNCFMLSLISKGSGEMLQWDHRALTVLDQLTHAGYRTVLVGGCVRDFLLGVQPHDYDAATAATPEEMLEVHHLSLSSPEGAHQPLRRLLRMSILGKVFRVASN